MKRNRKDYDKKTHENIEYSNFKGIQREAQKHSQTRASRSTILNNSTKAYSGTKNTSISGKERLQNYANEEYSQNIKYDKEVSGYKQGSK